MYQVYLYLKRLSFAATFHLNPQYRITLEDPDGEYIFW